MNLMRTEGIIFDENAESYKHWDDRNVLLSLNGCNEIVQTDHNVEIIGLNGPQDQLLENLTLRFTNTAFATGPGAEERIPETNSCAICNETSPDTTLLGCLHCFHWKCLVPEDVHNFPLHFMPSSVVCRVCGSSCMSWERRLTLQ